MLNHLNPFSCNIILSIIWQSLTSLSTFTSLLHQSLFKEFIMSHSLIATNRSFTSLCIPFLQFSKKTSNYLSSISITFISNFQSFIITPLEFIFSYTFYLFNTLLSQVSIIFSYGLMFYLIFLISHIQLIFLKIYLFI